MTMTLIETKTLPSAAASIEFTSIPQTFTDLLVLTSFRSSSASATNGTPLSLNGTTVGFTNRMLFGFGASVASAALTNEGMVATGNGATSNTFANGMLYIPNYTGSTHKSFSIDASTENNATAVEMVLVAGLFSNTAAITSITFTPQGGNNLLTGSTMSLYGILKGSDGIVTTS